MRLALVVGLIAAILLASEPAAGMRGGARVSAPEKAASNAYLCAITATRECLDLFIERQEILQDAKKLKTQLEILLLSASTVYSKEELLTYIRRCQNIIESLTTGPRRIQ